MHVAGQVLEGLLYLYIVLLWIRFVAELVTAFAPHWTPRGVALLVLEAVLTLTDPPVKAVRRVVPRLRLGPVALDLSLYLVLIAAYLLRYLVHVLFL